MRTLPCPRFSKLKFLRLTGGLLLILNPLARLTAAQPYTSVWAGGTDLLGTFNLVELDLRPTPVAPHGTVEIRTTNTGPLPIRALSVADGKMSFELPTPRGLISFSGQLQGDRLDGIATDEFGAKKNLHAWQTKPVDAAEQDGCVGRFTYADGLIEVSYAPKGQLAAIAFAQRDGKESITRSLRLLPISATEYYAAGAVVGSLKLNETVRFTAPKDGHATQLTWQFADGKTFTATRADTLVQERVSFAGPAGHLEGLLIKPAGAGPFPAMVQVHGSGPVTRDNIYLRARAWAEIGVATLLYDKRGTGDSAGDFRASLFGDFADDAVAAWKFLHTAPGIDPARIGLQAQSEGGWVAGVALLKDIQPAFVIMTSTGPIHPMDQEIYRAEAQVRRNGLSAADAQAAMEFMRLKWSTGYGHTPWGEYLAAAKKSAAEKWYPLVQGATVADAAEWKQTRALIDFDPAAGLRKIQAPTLVIVSSSDPLVPGERVATLWEALWKEARPIGSEIAVLPGLDHGLLVKNEGKSITIEPAAPRRVAEWLRKNNFLR